MKEISKAWLLALPNIYKSFTSVGFWLSYIFFVSMSFSFYWNSDKNTLLSHFGAYSFNFMDEETAYSSIFYEYYFYWWIVLMFVFILPKLLFTLKKSFSISETLWVKFNNTSNITISISRVLFILSFVLFVGVISLIWCIVFSFANEIPFMNLTTPIIGLISHIIVSAGITILICSSHKLPSELGILFTFIALIIPVFLKLLKAKFNQFGDYFPYSMPLSLGDIVPSTKIAYINSIILGLLLISIYLIKNFVSHLKHVKL